LTLLYLDEVGFSLALPVSYTWSKRGTKNRLRVPMRWGSHGRLNLIGALAWGKEQRTLERAKSGPSGPSSLHFELVEKSVKSDQVTAFIDALSKDATPDQLTVVVLDNARFHTSTKVKEKRPLWEERGVFLRYLPPYAPHLNPIEALWKHLKSFLLPRRCYDSVVQLRQAVLEALNLLGAIRFNSNVGEAYIQVSVAEVVPAKCQHLAPVFR
jgi:putative transposase